MKHNRRSVSMYFLSCAFNSCSKENLRPPDNVPASATFVQSVKGGYWHTCAIKEDGDCHCTIYHLDGRVAISGVFVPYEGSSPTKDSLVVSGLGTSDTVRLANGQLLIPKSDYEAAKRFWDWRLGKVARP